jgi:CRP/FNR family transcriptional regulator, cyclic AMP receptor protein
MTRSTPPNWGRLRERGTSSVTLANAKPASGTFLALLTNAEREGLEALASRRRFARGAMLMLQGETGRAMLLLEGRVKVELVDEEGHATLLSIRDPGDVLGELALVDREPHVATVSALEPVVALEMAAAALRAHLEHTPRVAVALLEVIVRRFREATARRSELARLDTTGRLAARIVELVDRYGEPVDADLTTVLSPLSREELAAWTGASRASFARALHDLVETGWVQTEGRTLLVRDLAALRGRALSPSGGDTHLTVPR